MLAQLAKLSILKTKDFGIACFTTLTDIMKSGAEMENLVIKFLEEDVINKLRQDDPKKIPAPLLIGLYELVKETDKPELLYNLFDASFPKWIESYITNYIDKYPKMGNDDHYDAVLMLMSTAVHDDEGDEGVKRVLDSEDMCKKIAKIIIKSSWEHDRYIPCLNLIANLSNSDANAATEFVD